MAAGMIFAFFALILVEYKLILSFAVSLPYIQQERSDMTPAHQSIVDNMLKALASRANEMIRHLAYPLGTNPPQLTMEQLRGSPLGQDLTNIAHYAEGYTIEGNVDEMIQRVFRYSFAPPIQFGTTTNPGLRLPKGWHKTPFALLIGNAYRNLSPARH